MAENSLLTTVQRSKRTYITLGKILWIRKLVTTAIYPTIKSCLPREDRVHLARLHCEHQSALLKCQKRMNSTINVEIYHRPEKQLTKSENNSMLAMPVIPYNDDWNPIMISHVESPELFFVHLVNNISANIDRFHENLNAHYALNMEILNGKELPVGSYWAVHCESAWYRGMVLDNVISAQKVKDSSKVIKVRLVDYGDTAYVKMCDIRGLHDDFIYMPILAVPCSLVPVVSGVTRNSLSPEARKEKFIIECGGENALLNANFLLADS
ncbi:hypothetical protein SK128_018999 [Halocaridina rubra]|uniref:Tudor domain-containing protein n=1 Tax=Halocaridina rubra TaxID=373956 RepID=A0AAN8X0U3_HALRR